MEKKLMYSNTKGNKTPQHLWHRLLLVLITMLTGITGVWATEYPFYTGAQSTYEIDGQTIILRVNATNELTTAANDWQKWSYGNNMPSDIATAKTNGFSVLKIITASGVDLSSTDGECLYCFGNNYSVLDLSDATVTLNDGKCRLGGTTDRHCPPNIIVPAAYSADPSEFPAANQDGNPFNNNKYSVDGTTINACFGDTNNLPDFTNISSTATTLKAFNFSSGDLSSTGFNTYDFSNTTLTGTTTVPTGTTVYVNSTAEKAYVTGTDPTKVIVYFNGNMTVAAGGSLGTNITSDLNNYGANNQLSNIATLTVTGELTTTDTDWLNTNKSSLSDLTAVDLSGVTSFGSGVSKSTIGTALPNGVAITYPSFCDFNGSASITTTSSSNVQAQLEAYLISKGELSSNASNAEKTAALANVTSLTISGPLTSEDVTYLSNLTGLETLNLTGVTGFGSGVSKTTINAAVPNGATVIYPSAYTVSGCNVTINMSNALGSEMSTILSEAKAAVVAGGQTNICTLTVVGELGNNDLAILGDAVMTGASRIDLSGATLASGASIDNLQLPSSLTSLVLPKDKTVSTALSARMTAITGLMYAYSPSSDASSTHNIADYIWVNKAGGLAQALTNESSSLGTSHYIKVASYVELNDIDVDMSDKGINAVEYLDLSDANISPNLAGDFVKPHNSSYRIILPDDWTADQMAAFNNNSNKGTMVAVYSYTGTTLKILEIDDNNYMTGALKNPRIVRSGTTAIEVVGKLEQSDGNWYQYGDLGNNLIAALNQADDAPDDDEVNNIKTININVGQANTILTTISFTNTNIEHFTMAGVKNKNNASTGPGIDVSECTNLQTIDVSNSTLQLLDAHGLTKLTSVNMSGTLMTNANGVSGETILTGCTSLTTSGFVTTNTTQFIKDLKLINTGLTSFATPAKVTGDIYLNATTSLTSLDLTLTQFQNETSKIHVHATDNESDTNPISGLNNSTYKTISVPYGFNKTRIHPNDNNVLNDNILEEEPTVVENAYTETGTDMTFHDKEAGDKTDHYRYWYQGSLDEDGIITLGTSTTRLATLITGHPGLKNDTHAKIRIVGPLTSADVDALKNLNCTALDLSNATSGVDGTTIGELLKAKFQTTGAVHSNTKFIALPDTCSRDFILNATALDGLKSSVYCVIAVNDVSNGKDLTSYSFQSGSLQPAVAIFQNSSAQSWTTIKDGYSNTRPKYASTVSTFKKLKIGGLINSYDLAGPAQGINLNDDGHLVFNEAANENDYAQKRTMNGGNTIYGPFSSCFLITEIDLRDAYLEEKGDNTGLPDEQYYRYWGEDITLSALGVISTATYKVVIPQDKRVHELPADFMNCSTNIRAICIPSNIQAIRTRAFWTIDYVWTTADAFQGGNDPEGENTRLDNGAKLRDGTKVNALLYNTTTQKYEENPEFSDSYYTADYSGVNGGGSYTFGSTLKMIESGAFANTQPNVKDVYVLNTKAPECHVDAFNTVMYTGNGGYNPTEVTNEGIITREAYFNGRWITMLHYPRQTTDPNIQRYTDPTREYSIATGERDGKGAIIYFPNHSEFIRAYQQGTFGYTWRAWDPTRAYGSVNNGNMTNTTEGWTAKGQTGANAMFDDYASGTDHQYRSFYKVSGFGTNDGITAPTATLVPYYNVNWSGSTYSTVTPQANLYPQSEIDAKTDADGSGEKTPKDYRGWHQFVLTAYAANTVLEEEPYRSYITDNEWWTICPEFDITRYEAALLFGKVYGITTPGQTEYPKVHKLQYVRRTYENGVIHLCFTKDLATYKEDRNNATVTYTRDGESNITGVTAFADQHGSVNQTTGVIKVLADAPASDDVVMSAGVPYLIKPNLPVNAKRQYIIFKSLQDAQNYNNTHKAATDPVAVGSETLYYKIKHSQELSGTDQRAIIKSGTYTVPVFVLDYSGSTYTLENVETTSDVPIKFRTNDEVMGATEYYRSTDRHYTFVGTFYKSFLPHFSYFLGWDTSINGARFFYHNGNFATIDNEMRWANGTGVIVPTLADDLEGNPFAFKYSVTQASDMAHPAQWDLLTTFLDDSFVTSGGNGAKQYIMELEAPDMKYSDNIDTGIENIEANKESGANISAAQGVYTLDGRKVADTLQGLPKGIYVVNGKKFVVK